VSHARDTTLEQGKSVRRKDRQRQRCDELIATPVPRPPVPLRGRRERKLAVKLSAGRREGWGEDVLKFVVFSHYSALTFDWQQVNFPVSSLVCPWH